MADSERDENEVSAEDLLLQVVIDALQSPSDFCASRMFEVLEQIGGGEYIEEGRLILEQEESEDLSEDEGVRADSEGESDDA